MEAFTSRALVHSCICIGLLPSMALAQKPELIVQTGHTFNLDYLDSPGYLYYAKINSLAISGDDRILASASDDFTIKLWDLAAGKELRSFIGHTGPVEAVAFSPDAKILASGGDDEGIKLWDVARGDLIRTLEVQHATPEDKGGYEREFYTMAFCPDGKSLAAQSEFGLIKLWRTTGGPETMTLPLRGMFFDPSFARSCGRISFGSGGQVQWNIYKLWNIATGHETRPQYPLPDFSSAALGPEGRIAAFGENNGAIRLWEVASRKEIRTLQGHTHSVSVLAFSGDGKVFASADVAGNILVWDTGTGHASHVLKTTTDPHIRSITLSSNGATLVSGSNDGTIVVWDTVRGMEQRTLRGSSDIILSVRGHPGGNFLASANAKGTKIWGLSTGQVLQNIEPTSPVRAVAFSPSGATLALGTQDNRVTLWDFASGKEVDAFRDRGSVASMAFRPRSNNLATIVEFQNEPHLQIWDLPTHQIVREFVSHSVGMIPRSATTFSPDGNTLAEEDKLWEFPSGKEIHTLEGHSGAIDAVAFSLNGKILATGSRDQTIKLWDVKTGKLIHTLLGHNSYVTALAFAPDRKTLASGSRDGTIKIWDLSTGRTLRSQRTLAYQLHSVAFSPDGKLLTVAGVNRIELWSLTEDQGLRQLCTLFSFIDGGWAVVDTDGRFDTDNLDQINGLNWVFPDEPFRALAPEIFMRDYYQPKLLPRLLRGEKLPQVRSLGDLNRAQPQVDVVKVEPEAGEGLVSVTIRVTEAHSAVQKDNRGNPLPSGAYDLRLFRSGQLVGQWPEGGVSPDRSADGAIGEAERESWRTIHRIELPDGRCTRTFSHIRLPHRPGVNKVEFTAYAFNSDRVKSLTTPPYEYKLPTATLANAVSRRAYLITMGVNANQSRWNLELAVSSAERAGQLLRGKLQTTYQDIVEVPLYSDLAENGVQVVSTRARKAHLQAVLDLLAGRSVAPALRDAVDKDHKLRPATPDDAVVLYIASHGYADPQGNFYLIPYDTGTSWGITEEVLNGCYGESASSSGSCKQAVDFLQHAISSTDLAAWWQGVDAGDMVMILDSCHAGAVPGREFRPGPLGDPGFGQLSYDKGMRILCASQPAQTEQGDWIGGGEGRTLLVEALDTVAQANPSQRLAEWLKGTERQLPIRMRELYPQINEADVQLPALLDFVRAAK
jgi:WD40 repeat protein